jgi:hypothetical protein
LVNRDFCHRQRASFVIQSGGFSDGKEEHEYDSASV